MKSPCQPHAFVETKCLGSQECQTKILANLLALADPLMDADMDVLLNSPMTAALLRQCVTAVPGQESSSQLPDRSSIIEISAYPPGAPVSYDGDSVADLTYGGRLLLRVKIQSAAI